MNDAQWALQKASDEIPKDVAGRFTTADKLSDDDRKAVLDIATKVLAQFSRSRPPRRRWLRSPIKNRIRMPEASRDHER